MLSKTCDTAINKVIIAIENRLLSLLYKSKKANIIILARSVNKFNKIFFCKKADIKI